MDGNFTYAKQVMLDMYNYSTNQELMAVSIKECFTPESYAAYLENQEKRKRGEMKPVNSHKRIPVIKRGEMPQGN